MKTKELPLSTTIYTTRIGKVQTIFLPTSQRVKRAYHNGEVGDQLWEQITGGRFTQNMWTMKEINTIFRVAGHSEPIKGVVNSIDVAMKNYWAKDNCESDDNWGL